MGLGNEPSRYRLNEKQVPDSVSQKYGLYSHPLQVSTRKDACGCDYRKEFHNGSAIQDDIQSSLQTDAHCDDTCHAIS